MIGSELLRFQNSQEYLIFDEETEGLNLYRSRIWELSYALCNNRNLQKPVTRYLFYKDLEVSEEAARITRFDKRLYLERAEDPAVVLKDFEEIAMDPSILPLGHNILGYDAYPWQTTRRIEGLPRDWSYTDRMIDTLCLARAYRHQITPDTANFKAWQYKMLTLRSKKKGFGASLGAMAKEFGIPYDERFAHGAEYDLGVNHEVFKALIWKLDV